MTADRYICCDDERRAALLQSVGPLTGIDYIEVEQGEVVADDSFIDVYLVKPLAAGDTLDGGNFVISGGVRFPAPPIAAAVTPIAGGIRITLPGNHPTDFSTYRLSLVAGPGKAEPPEFIDPRFASVAFSFKIDCAGDFDCAPSGPVEAPEALPPDPPFDYRARDYQGFRRLMLDRLSSLLPGFREDDPADFTTTLVEALAYRADQQSYRLDWVGTEAFLGTARSRASLTRHARLVDYTPGQGASARVFAQFRIDAGSTEIPSQTPLLLKTPGLPPIVDAPDYLRLLAGSPTVFETAAKLVVDASHDSIAFYTWGDSDCRLPRGATSATVRQPAKPLAAGDFLLLAETRSPETGDRDDARRDRRHIVRLTQVESVKDPLFAADDLATLEWAASDALPFDLVITAQPKGAVAGAPAVICAEASGNIVPADHGVSLPPAADLKLQPSEAAAFTPRLAPATPTTGEVWRPVLDRPDVARIAPIDLRDAMNPSAAGLATPDPEEARPALRLDDGSSGWESVWDLLRSTRFDTHFVVESGLKGEALIRFGDGLNGIAPAAGTAFAISGRFGSGQAGNIAQGALAHLVLAASGPHPAVTVTNPLPARGGVAPESFSSIRIAAPQAFRRQERAVTAADYAEAACRHPEVANAYAVPHWTGAWQTMLVYLDRKGGLPVDRPFRDMLAAHLERVRLMGFDVAVRGAEATPLDIELFVCARPDQIRASVEQRVRATLRPGGPADGSPGFFHPDNFTFGTPLYLSRLIAAVMAVAGVQSVTVRRFQRWGRVSFGELADGAVRPSDAEILELLDDPSFPERGRLAIEMGGGR